VTRSPSPRERVHLVVACANRKTQPVPSSLQLRHIVGADPARRAALWVDQLEQSTEPTMPARKLYAGEHWQVVRGLESIAATAGLDASLWVCSAGYGLVSADAPLRPYAATFATGHADSVSADPGNRPRWWTSLTDWKGPVPSAPRTLRDLARGQPHAVFLVALSSAYLAACTGDLLGLADELASPEQLTIISTGTRSSGPLGRHLAPATAQLQPVLGGTRQSLNARVLAYLLREQAAALTHTYIQRVLGGLLAAAPPLARYERTPRTDRQVEVFIRRRLASEPRVTASRLLREFRDLGYACEQGRFAALYRAVCEDR
jgi:anti-sigma factor RsiW